MSVTTPARATPNPTAPIPPLLRGRRAPRHVLVGVGLMATFALLFAVVALREDPATPLLAVARPVAVGQPIASADLEVVRAVPGPGMEVVPEAERSAVVGRTATVPLVPGSLLVSAQVGAAAWPPPGEAVIAVPVAEGRLPSGVSTGSRVSVLAGQGGTAESTGEARPGTTAVTATVVAVEPPTAAGVRTVSLLLDAGRARQVAAAGGEVTLVLESPTATGAGG